MTQQLNNTDDFVIEALVTGTLSDPFSVLGIHKLDSGKGKIIRVFLPGAEAVEAVNVSAKTTLCKLTCIHDMGVFEGVVTTPRITSYKLLVHYPQASVVVDDPYRFPASISSEDLYLFHEGRHEKAYQFLGANSLVIDDVEGVHFAVWAPNARRAAVVGDFNNWDDRVHAMRLHFDSGIWELFVPGVSAGEHYKFAINSADGSLLPLKSDPFARRMELRPGTASRIPTITSP